jgi:RHH-type proline utilization regulon transcriptional repressor/proline dehydrogenase/delta 1-pyrroline-5-carboxylate dehydrogenase
MHTVTPLPFAAFAPSVGARSALRQRITQASRRPEPDCVAALIAQAQTPDDLNLAIRRTTIDLVTALRTKGQRGGVEGLVKEYALSSHEGVALMCLAEALLRIPDNATRDALIRDKIAGGDWQAHLGPGSSVFVNAATWGLMVTGKLVGSVHETGLAAALTRLIARAGEPVIRRGVDMAMQLMGEQFVIGETVASALKRARKLEAQGFAYSYDMLGEAATTAADAQRYLADYKGAIHAIGAASAGRGVRAGPGISIKLSALHPRYARSQMDRVLTELLPRVRDLAVLARHYDIGFNIDAEEADRLEISLDVLEALALDPALAGWDGLGFVVQAYGKRCPAVIDWLADLASRAGRRIMVRLVKGAYWDSEIKRAQVEGLADFPVFTRKVHTDLSYIACARKLLAARDRLFPQFATHNAQTLATIYHLAGSSFTAGDFEFQCLHGMGEPLYEEVVGAGKLGRPCRIYAPVGTHETLLAYLVRRLLENGANSSFVHRIWDAGVAPEELAADPVTLARAVVPLGAPHPVVALPADILAGRRNSAGIDLADDNALAELSVTLQHGTQQPWQATPLIAGWNATRPAQAVRNPADHRDVVGTVSFASLADAAAAMDSAANAAADWAATPVETRAAMLDRAADLLQQRMPTMIGLIVREAGKSAANAVGEVREAVDFLRYYAAQARTTLNDAQPLGPAVCISPWNFPLAIFTGQIAAALVAGNPVLAKPAEETPLIAAEATRLLHEAGIPPAVLQLLPGDGRIGAALVAHPATAAVLFTGSTEVARLIQIELAGHVTPHGGPVPLIAETGGQNAMIVDSSALAEQVTADVIASAFDSAGQRCSALRILCLQDDIADRQLAMITGALGELRLGNPDRLATDIGPVISAEARETIEAHIAAMAAAGRNVTQMPLPDDADHGTFVAPAIIEIDRIDQLGREVFGPVLHVLRYRRDALDSLIDAINATGYGLTFGLHTRIDETISAVTSRIAAGNIYVNRNVIGAVVGVQPFGGHGLSGTGPKAGGPLYLGRLVAGVVESGLHSPAGENAPLNAFAQWLAHNGESVDLDHATNNLAGCTMELAGPVGERNLYALHPRKGVLLVPETRAGLIAQAVTALAAGCTMTIVANPALAPDCGDLRQALGTAARWIDCVPEKARFSAALVEPKPGGVIPVLRALAVIDGPIPLIQMPDGDARYRMDWLVEEVSTSINTTAAGGNASLMALV